MTQQYALTAGTSILRISDGAMIPPDPANYDYRAYLAWVAAGGTADPYVMSPSAQIATLLAGKIAAGIAVTSGISPTLDTTFALDATTMDQIGSVARDSASGLGLPGGSITFTYPDLAGVSHSFTGAQIVALYKAQRDLLLALNTQAAIMARGGSPAWPAQTAVLP